MNDLPTVTGLGHEDLFSSHQVTFSKAAPLESRMSLINLTTKKLYPNGGEDVIHQEQQQTCPLKQGHAIWNQPKQGTKGKSLKTTIHLQNQNLFGFFQTISNFPSLFFFFKHLLVSTPNFKKGFHLTKLQLRQFQTGRVSSPISKAFHGKGHDPWTTPQPLPLTVGVSHQKNMGGKNSIHPKRLMFLRFPSKKAGQSWGKAMEPFQ